MKNQLRPAVTIFARLTIMTGGLYPLVMTGIAQASFPHQANGSLITIAGRTHGSELVGQQFDDPGYFWGRPSAAGYNAAASSGSNYAPANPSLEEADRTSASGSQQSALSADRSREALARAEGPKSHG